jgi:hypothetical protein
VAYNVERGVKAVKRNWWLICGYCHNFTTDIAAAVSSPVSVRNETPPMKQNLSPHCRWCTRKGALLEGWIPEGYLPTWWGYYDGYEDVDE